eukprot:gene17966-biopygen6875
MPPHGWSLTCARRFAQACTTALRIVVAESGEMGREVAPPACCDTRDCRSERRWAALDIQGGGRGGAEAGNCGWRGG